MKPQHHYRLRIHFNNGFNAATVPLIACSTFEEAKVAFEKYCHRVDQIKGHDHIKSIALLAGHKRPCFQRFEGGVRL